MDFDISSRLKKAKEEYRLRKKWEKQLIELESMKEGLERELDLLAKQLKGEKRDVERLERVTLTNILLSVTGKKLEKEDKERRELAQVELKYFNKKQELSGLEKELERVKGQLKSKEQVERDYFSLVQEKEEWIRRTESAQQKELDEIDEELGNLDILRKEYEEAQAAGMEAESNLREAIDALNDASGWSTWDMMGGGLLSTAIKHSSLDRANEWIEHAQAALRKFQLELEDIQFNTGATFKMDGFLTFADYFFDNFFVDWAVHGKINESLEQTVSMRKKVLNLLERLEAGKGDLLERIEQLERKRQQVIENA